MPREIHLNGGEISILKTLGLSGASMPGKLLAQRAGEMEPSELVDALAGLLALDYLTSNKISVRTIEEVERAFFRVNPVYAEELRDALHPSRARAREPRERRRRA